MNAEDMIDPRDPTDRTEIGRKPSADQALLDAINESDRFDGCAHDCADRGTDAPVDPYDKQVDDLARCWPGGAFDDAIMEMPRLLGQYQASYEESKRHKAAAAKAEQRCADIDACIKYIEKHKSVPAWAYRVTDTYR